MFERKAMKELQRWAENPHRKPLVLRGARQVGKTSLVKTFGRTFDNFLSLNLEKREARILMESTDEVKSLLPALFLYCDVQRKPGRTLLFIDEIQNSPQTVALLRYFYEELPELYVIAAGSLLETLLDRRISLPVGRVEYCALHPCTFTEFLTAMGEERFVEPLLLGTLPAAFHERMNDWFNKYALIGGMPEVVAHFAESRDVKALSGVYNQLLVSYRNDVEKYAESRTQRKVIRYILEEGWGYAGETITLGGFASSAYKARETGEAFRTLEKAMLLELVYPTTFTQLPATPDLKRAPKLCWLDVGIVNYAASIQKEYLLTKDLLDVWRGGVAEQVVAQGLKALTNEVGQKNRFWVRSKRGSSAEVDFVYIKDGEVVPIEVKSGNNAHLRSLQQFMSESGGETAVRIWSGSYSVDKVTTPEGRSFRLINLPFYLLEALPRILDEASGRAL